jgi:hypothetical protein
MDANRIDLTTTRDEGPVAPGSGSEPEGRATQAPSHTSHAQRATKKVFSSARRIAAFEHETPRPQRRQQLSRLIKFRPEEEICL